MLRRRGAAEAGAIFIKIDRLDGTCSLYAPAPASELPDGTDRLWSSSLTEEWTDCTNIEHKIQREIKFDPDLWLIEVEDKQGRHFLDLANDLKK